MADPLPASYRSLRDYRDRIPGHRQNSRVHLSTLLRWVLTGVSTPSGDRVRLRAVRAGSKWLTTDEWFDDFLRAQTAAATPQPQTGPHDPSPATTQRRSEAAKLELIRRGA